MKIDLNDAKRLSWRLALAAATVAALPTFVGCQAKDAEADESAALHGPAGDQFLADDEPRHVQRVLNAQAASGARADATLHACHFDSAKADALNSLGHAKLDLMLADDDALPLAVYLDVPQDEDATHREQSVRTFLKDRGLSDAQIKVVVGRNPASYGSVAARLKAVQAAEANPQAGAAVPVGGGAAAAK